MWPFKKTKIEKRPTIWDKDLTELEHDQELFDRKIAHILRYDLVFPYSQDYVENHIFDHQKYTKLANIRHSLNNLESMERIRIVGFSRIIFPPSGEDDIKWVGK